MLVLLFLQRLLPAPLQTGSWPGWTSTLRAWGPSSAFKTHRCVEEPNGSRKPFTTQTTDQKTLAALCFVAHEIFFFQALTVFQGILLCF